MAGEYIFPLADLRATLENVGGKGASLARLANAGLPVPGGFHITTTAYERFVSDNNLQRPILEALRAVDLTQLATLESASRTIAYLFVAAPMPRETVEAIDRAYSKLPGAEPAVAVRSSATAEDLPGLSFAGQQDTYLNIHGLAAVQDAVKRCWASLWTARAIGYRLRMGIDQQAVAMGVVVQNMVPSDIAGVLFTANPTTGERDELVVNASFGLGEAIVSGRVTPDSYRLDKSSLALKETVLGTKETMVVSTGQGTTTRALSEGQQGEQALSAQLLRELGGLAIHVEKLFEGVPQDIEWAVADGRCWLLQARPITGLPPAPLKDVRWEPPVPGTKWVRRQVAENMPEPLSPLFEELYVKRGLEDAVNGVWEMAEWKGDPEEVYDRPMYTTVNGYAYSRAAIKRSWKSAQIIMGIFATGYVRIFRRGISLWTDDFLPPYLATVERWKAIDPKAARDEQLLEGIRELAYDEALYWYGTTIALALAKVSDVILNQFLAIVVRRKGITSALFLRGFPTKAVEAEAELEAIAEQIRGSGRLRELVSNTPAQRLLEALEATPAGHLVLDRLRLYLGRYGHLVYNLDFVEPSQAEAPMPVLVSLKASVERPGKDVLRLQAEMAEERDRLVETTLRSMDPVRRRPFLSLLRWAQRLTPYREEALFYMGSAWSPLRRLALELGHRLAVAGLLGKPDDVFFLESAELAEAIQLRAAGQSRPDLISLVRERRDLREARKRLHPPAAVPPNTGLKFGPIDLSGLETQKRNVGTGPLLSGFAVSPGRVTAPATVILSPADFHKMEPDTILVCPTTTPAWTPLFAQARGLVTDIGGVAAHGSIVAREYGIPAVMGTGSATQRVANGQRITVDGNAGIVTLNGEECDGLAPSRGAAQLRAISMSRERRWLAAAALLIAFIWLKKRRSRDRQTAGRSEA